MADAPLPAAPPPAASSKKKGLGCLGCGCLILAILALLVLGLIGMVGYVGYSKLLALTTTTPPSIPTFDGGDSMYESTKQKISEFKQNLHNHQPSTLHLTADEINTLIAHTPELASAKVQLFVTMSGDEARLKVGAPMDHLMGGIMKGRFISGEIDFNATFDTPTHAIVITPTATQIGPVILTGPGAQTPEDKAKLVDSMLGNSISQALTQEFQKDPEGQLLLQQAKTFTIKNGELLIETQ